MSLAQDTIPTHSVKSILLRLPNWLGDSVMVSPAFEWLKQSFKNADFTLVGTKASCGIYERDSRVKHIFIDESKSAKCRIYAIKKLAKNVGIHDISITFANTFFSALFLFFSKSKVRIGYAKNARSFLLTHALPLHHIKGTHQVHLYLKLIAPLESVQQQAYKAYQDMLDSENEAEFLPQDSVQLHQWLERIEQLLLDYKSAPSLPFRLDLLPILAKKPLSLISYPLNLATQNTQDSQNIAIGINPGAAFGSAKCWEKSYFVEIIKHFLTLSYDVYLFGSSDTKGTNAQIADSIASHSNARFFHNLTDKTNLNQLIDYINAMNVFITNDSGPMHIAAALKVPMVAIFGPTNIKETAPYKPTSLKKLPFLLHTNDDSIDSQFIESSAQDKDRATITAQDSQQVSQDSHHAQNPYESCILLCKYVPCSPCKKRECPLKHHNCMKLITPQEVITHTMNLLKNNEKRLSNDT
ncbi:glycosyltransferase family 9 protein [Helicobacter typhlonius]|uniref:glycosyltransferase family 9 protein n=1 Tax=Helicobacter typhlonius TaxID=76936 RepID=UPI002FE0FB3B